MDQNKLAEELLSDTTTPIKAIPVVTNTPSGLTPGNIWFNKGTKKLSVVRTDNTVVELGGNSKLVNKIDIVPEYMSLVKYDNLGYKVTFDLDTIPITSAGRKYTKPFDFNYRTSKLVFLTTDQKTIQILNIQNRSVQTVTSSKDILSFHCSLSTSLCYILFTDKTVGYLDLNSSSPSIGSISLPTGVTVGRMMNTKFNVYIHGTDGKLYIIPAGSTAIIDSTIQNLYGMISNSNSRYCAFRAASGLYVMGPESNTTPKKFYNNTNLPVPSSCLYDPTTENIYITGDLIQTWPVSKSGYTHYSDIYLNSMPVELLQLASKNLALSFDGILYSIDNYVNYRRIQTPAPVYQVAGYDDYVILVDKNGDVHYFSVKDEQIISQGIVNVRSTTSYQLLLSSRNSVITGSNPQYTSATPDSDYYSAKSISLTLPSTYNYTYPIKIVKFTLTDNDVIQNMTSNYNNLLFKYQGVRIPFKVIKQSDTSYDIYLLISDPITSTSITVVCNYQPKINYPNTYTLEKRQSVGFSNKPSTSSSHNVFSVPVYIRSDSYSKYKMKIITYPTNNVMLSWIFNDQFPLMKKTRLLGRTFYTANVPCSGFNSDIVLLVNEVEIDNIPNKGVIIRTNLVRPETFEIKEYAFIPASELTTVDGYYKIGTVYTEGRNIPSYVIVTRVI